MTTYIGQFKKGMKVGSETHLEFELREMTTADMLDAELLVQPGRPMNFNAAMASLQLVRVGTYDGPFTLKMVRSLAPVDFDVIVDGLNKVATLGEESSPGAETD